MYFHLRQIVRAILLEGGLKLPPNKRLDLNATLVKKACDAYIRFLYGWNRWLTNQGLMTVKPVGPSGSSAHAEMDAAEGKDVIYGDVDFLVEFPLTNEINDFSDRRKEQSKIEREYTALMGEYIHVAKPQGVNIELTLKPNSIPSQVVLELDNGELVQVDTVVTFPEHTEWMKGRYVPERGIKGYVTGNLYKSLGDYLTLTIGTEGVIARLYNGTRVSSKQRAGVKYEKISGDFRNFLSDIAKYLTGGNAELSPKLLKYPGLDPNAVSISDLAHGIVGLAETLDNAGIVAKHEMLSKVLDGFKKSLADTVEKKSNKQMTSDKIKKLLDLNDNQIKRVAEIFRI